MEEKGSHNRAVVLVGPASAVRHSVYCWQSMTFVRSRRKKSAAGRLVRFNPDK
jgi:hypothetical protein